MVEMTELICGSVSSSDITPAITEHVQSDCGRERLKKTNHFYELGLVYTSRRLK